MYQKRQKRVKYEAEILREKNSLTNLETNEAVAFINITRNQEAAISLAHLPTCY